MSSCSLPEKVERPSLNISQISNCPKPPSEPPAIEVNEQANNIYNAFNYQIEKTIADTNAIAFSGMSILIMAKDLAELLLSLATILQLK